LAEILLSIIGISAIAAIPAQSVVLGLNTGRPYFKELLSQKSLLARFTITMFVIIPAVVILFSFITGNLINIWSAVLIISVAPASPGVIKNMRKLEGDQNVSTAWMILTMILSLIFFPLILLSLEKYLDIDLKLGISDVLIKLMLLFIFPMSIGFLISKYFQGKAEILKKILIPLSKVAMITLIISLLISSVPMIISKGMIPVILLLSFIIVSLIIAHLMGSPGNEFGPILPYSIILRLPAPAVILTKLNNTMEIHLPVLISYTILAAIVMMVYNKIFFREKRVESI